MAADADSRPAEREHDVEDHVEPDLRCELLHAPVPGDDEGGRHEAEDRTGGAHRGLVRVQEQSPEGAGQEGDEIDTQEPRRADPGLEQPAEDEEGEHIDGDVQESGVQKSAGDDSPHLAIRDRRGIEAGVVDHRAAPPERGGATTGQLDEESGQVERDQRVGRRRGTGPQAAPEPAHLSALPSALRAAHAHRGDRHAIGADGPPAVGAGDVRLPARVAIADGHGGGIYWPAISRRPGSSADRRERSSADPREGVAARSASGCRREAPSTSARHKIVAAVETPSEGDPGWKHQAQPSSTRRWSARP